LNEAGVFRPFQKQDGLTKIPDHGSGIDEAKDGSLLFSSRHAHIDLPTMRGLDVMMVMNVRRQVVHNVWQYTNVFGISQAKVNMSLRGWVLSATTLAPHCVRCSAASNPYLQGGSASAKPEAPHSDAS